MYAESVEFSKKGPERAWFSTVMFFKRIDHLMIRRRNGQVQVERRIIVMVPAFHAIIPVPEINPIPPGRIKDPHRMPPVPAFSRSP
jgi:hypothetical protein